MNSPVRRALFAGLVFNEEDEAAQEVYIGGTPYYAIPDAGFVRHVEAEYVDRQIVTLMQERIMAARDIITDGVIQMLGQEELFTRASVEHAIKNMDRILEPGSVDVDELRTALWMAKFRAVVDVHGDLIYLNIPGWEDREHA